MSSTEYNHKEIEQKWQKYWSENNTFKTSDKDKRPKYYILDMFPYPSGAGLHVGHPKGYIASDILSRFKRMNGFNVLHPMGWDAFGLPAENYALKTKSHPKESTNQNIDVFKNQISIIGLDYDWSREINTTDPEYYKWTQWIFLQLFKKGLAYESYEPINWCPSCKTGLANEDVEDGKCERCGTAVEKKPLRQWVLKIRDYADKLLEGIDDLDWPESIKESQRNWIGRSYGSEISFKIKAEANGASETAGHDLGDIKVFTTRADTLFGATYMVIAPEHPIVEKILSTDGLISNKDEIGAYRENAAKKDDAERSALDKEKTGVEIAGIKAINPADNSEIPVFVADYVLVQYGTGAIMAVPAHDERDYEFAQKYNLPIKQVIDGPENGNADLPFTGEGTLIDSGKFTGQNSETARKKITKYVKGTQTKNYKIRDWVFSRQRYWGEPIPIIHCDKCGPVAVSEKDLPVTLPDVESYEPTGTGESPLAGIEDWVNVKCPKCGGAGKRETNTMPQWAGSSWYYLRYIDPQNDAAFVNKKKEKFWSPVDMYIGGAEHATRHLIYARFWHKFLYDIGAVSHPEPFTKLQHVGLINGEDGRKMSKRWGNVVNPNDVVDTYGADTLRVFEMFLGPFDKSADWNTESIIGPRRFLEKVWRQQYKTNQNMDASSESALEKLTHQTIKKVTDDIERMDFNTAISTMMILVKKMEDLAEIPQQLYENLLKILSPFAPHITEEIWHNLGHENSINVAIWPEFDSKLAKEDLVKIGVQINGKVRAEVEITPNESEESAKEKVLKMPEVQKWTEGKDPKKFIYVPGRIINIVL